MHEPRTGWRIALRAVLALAAAGVRAQTIDDGLMMPRSQRAPAFAYAHDGWDRYWEGTLERDNGTSGRSPPRASAGWGRTDHDPLNVIAMLPWVKTHASAGVLSGLSGVPGLHRGLEVDRALDPAHRPRHAERLRGGLGRRAGRATTLPDFLPMSIGLSSRGAAGRLTLNFQTEPGLFLEGTGSTRGATA